MQQPPLGPPDPKATYPPGDDSTPGWGQSWGWNWTPDSAASAPPTWVGLPASKPIPSAPSATPPRRVRRGGARVWPVLIVIGFIAVRILSAGGFGDFGGDPQPTNRVRVTMNGPALAALPDSIGRFHRLGTGRASEFSARVAKQARTLGREADAAIYANHTDGLGFVLTVWSGTSPDTVEEYLRKIDAKMPALQVDQMQVVTDPRTSYACAPVAGDEPGSVCVWISATEIAHLRAFTTKGDSVDRIRSLHDAYSSRATPPG